jgi:hypothetical protein
MGLGPPVCEPCKLIMYLDEDRNPPWRCPLCGRGQDDDKVSWLFRYPRNQWSHLERDIPKDEQLSSLACPKHGRLKWKYVTTIKTCGICMEELSKGAGDPAVPRLMVVD